MSEEIKKEEKKCECGCDETCTCRNWLRHFLVVCFGCFAGVYMALGLHAYVHKPPMPVYIIKAPQECSGLCHKEKINKDSSLNKDVPKPQKTSEAK